MVKQLVKPKPLPIRKNEKGIAQRWNLEATEWDKALCEAKGEAHRETNSEVQTERYA